MGIMDIYITFIHHKIQKQENFQLVGYGIELPICECVYDILYNGANPREKLESLFKRTLKNEIN